MPSEELPVAVAQFAPGTDKAANLAIIRSLAQRAADRGARLVVFPEYSAFFTPELGDRAVAAAEPLDGPFVAEAGADRRKRRRHHRGGDAGDDRNAGPILQHPRRRVR